MPDANGKPLRADANTPSPVLSNTTYDIVKDTVTLGFPAAVTLYAGLATIWHWAFATEVVASAGLVGVFLGVLLKIASKRYEKLPVQYDGEFIANDPNPNAETFRLDWNQGLVKMSNQDEIRLKVVNLLPPEEPAESEPVE
jgi:hypothetical protein